eukprot:983823-Rhodomonas_salina.2
MPVITEYYDCAGVMSDYVCRRPGRRRYSALRPETQRTGRAAAAAGAQRTVTLHIQSSQPGLLVHPSRRPRGQTSLGRSP